MMKAEQIVTTLKSLYLPKHRYTNFGDVLLAMEAHGIRGVSASIEFDFPVTVIIGKNGSGKSTLAQLALCCYRYKLPGEQLYNVKNYYRLGDFFIKSNLDPEPYTSDGYLRYSFAVDPEKDRFEQVSLFDPDPTSYCHKKENIIRKVNSEWGGY